MTRISELRQRRRKIKAAAKQTIIDRGWPRSYYRDVVTAIRKYWPVNPYEPGGLFDRMVAEQEAQSRRISTEGIRLTEDQRQELIQETYREMPGLMRFPIWRRILAWLRRLRG